MQTPSKPTPPLTPYRRQFELDCQWSSGGVVILNDGPDEDALEFIVRNYSDPLPPTPARYRLTLEQVVPGLDSAPELDPPVGVPGSVPQPTQLAGEAVD